MAKTLYLFSGITPNTQGHPYFNIKNFDNYLTYLINNFTLVKQVNDDNYRINAGIIKLSYTGIETDLITYAIEIEGNKHRCYFIDKVNIQSNMLYLSVSIDYWGTYYLASRISYMHVTRCNRNIGLGIYDSVANIDPSSSIEIIRPEGRFYNNYEELHLVLQLSYNARSSIIGEDKISQAGIFSIPLTDFLPVTNFETLLSKIVAIVNGIYGVKSSYIFIQTENDAICTNAWLVPYDFLNDSAELSSVKIKTKYINLNQEVKDKEFTAYKLTPDIISYGTLIDFDLNKDYIAGTYKGEGIKLTRFTKDLGSPLSLQNRLRYGYKAIVTASDFKMFVFQGQTEKEITQAFELGVTGHSQVATGLSGIANVLTSVTGILKSYQRGGTLGAVNAFASKINNSNCENQINGNGGALVTYSLYNEHTDGKISKPFYVMAYKSAINEKKHARYFGASFDLNILDINSIFDFELLGVADYDLTYLVVDEITINELPTLPREAIENLFKNGIELFDYEGSTNN